MRGQGGTHPRGDASVGPVSNVVRIRVRLSGHVQGVGLRGTLSKFCLRRHVCGWMCNTDDPTVVVCELEGQRRSVDSVLRSLEGYFKDPGRCRSMSIEVVGETAPQGDACMREVGWAEVKDEVCGW